MICYIKIGSRMKKYFYSFSVLFGTCLCLVSPFLASVDKVSSSPRHSNVSADPKLNRFFDALENLQKKGLIDGEVLVAKGNDILLDLQSEDVGGQNHENDPQFMIGSVSKQFFAVALLKSLYDTSLADSDQEKAADVQNKLQQSISHYLPADSAVWNGEMPAWANTVTLHQLLSHTSGIFNYSDSEGFEYNQQLDPGMKFFEYPHHSADIIQLVSRDPLEFTPGTKFSYSNTGYMLIAEVIESVTSMSADEYLKLALFEPNGLLSTSNPTIGRLNELGDTPDFNRLAKEWKFDPLHNPEKVYPPMHSEDVSVAKGAASIMSTAQDLLKWNQALHKDKTVLPESMYQILVTANLDGYAYGIGVQNNELGKVYGHSGVIGAYRSYVMYAPAEDISIIVLSNVSYDWHKANSEIADLASSMASKVRDPEARFEMASQIMMENHPITRGHEAIMQVLNTSLQ